MNSVFSLILKVLSISSETVRKQALDRFQLYKSAVTSIDYIKKLSKSNITQKLNLGRSNELNQFLCSIIEHIELSYSN